jgi:hypothetical protein
MAFTVTRFIQAHAPLLHTRVYGINCIKIIDLLIYYDSLMNMHSPLPVVYWLFTGKRLPGNDTAVGVGRFALLNRLWSPSNQTTDEEFYLIYKKTGSKKYF